MISLHLEGGEIRQYRPSERLFCCWWDGLWKAKFRPARLIAAGEWIAVDEDRMARVVGVTEGQ